MRPPTRVRWGRVALGVCLSGCILLVAGKIVGWTPATVTGAAGLVAGIVFLLAVALRWVWQRVVYRVGVRLFVSYLLVGVVPLVVLALMSMLASYMIVGQYASARLAEGMRFIGAELNHLAERANENGMAGAVLRLRQAEAQPPSNVPRIEWVISQGNEVRRSEGLAAAAPGWADDGTWSGPVRVGGALALASVCRSGDRTVALLMPLDVTTASALSEGRFYEARFTTGNEMSAPASAGAPAGGAGLSFQIAGEGTGTAGKSETGTVLRVEGTRPGQAEVEPGWVTTGIGRGGLLSGRWVVWFRVGRAVRDWESGQDVEAARVVTLLKTSIRGAVADLVADPSGIGDDLLGILMGLGATFLVVYVLAAAMAAVMIVTVARSTARLTRGARAVSRGDLAYRIPVRRRDQLGDLAASFNDMSESVEKMLLQVAEKERLSRELELAREIQRSLLPPGGVVYGQIAFECHCSPAAEVGGDYFDVFGLDGGEVIVAIGDVAGHGISTGLLMAMVKSAVAALIGEGYRGVELLERLNRLLTRPGRGRRMVTLVLAEIDTRAGSLRLTSAGHPPAMLLSGDSQVQEVVLESLPLGFRWPDPPPLRSFPFPEGARLLLYSDGVVEALGPDGEVFGYDSLASSAARLGDAGSAEVVAGIVDDVRRHIAGAAQSDDVTVLIVEHLRSGGRSPGTLEDR